MFVTFFDTCMVSLTAIFVWRISPYIVFLPWLTIALLDGAFLSSSLTKVPDGAWFTITLAVVLACVFLIWRFGKEQQWLAEAEDRFPTSHFIQPASADDRLYLTKRFEGDPLSVVKGFGIFFDKAGETTPTVFSQFAIKLTAIPEVMVFFHLRPLEVPSVSADERHSVSRLAIPNCYRLVVRYGYNDEVVTQDLASVVYAQIRQYKLDEVNGKEKVEACTPATTNGAGTETNRTTEDKSTALSATHEADDYELAKIDAAFAHKVIFIIGKEQMKIKTRTNFFRKGLLSVFLWIRENTRNKMANLNVPADRVVEVGFLKQI
jgi:KUP system potassium uptake protein